MKILYIHQYFRTPQEPGGTRSYWFSRELLRRGHKVVMVTGTSVYHPEQSRECVDGIEVVYVKSDYSNYFSPLRRVCSFVKFIWLAMRVAMRESGVDIVYATSTPLTIGAIALILRRLKGWRYIFEVRDLWPEFPIQMGVIRNRLLIKILRGFERRIYERSECVVALSEGMRDGVIAAGTSEERVVTIPNMSKPNEFFPREVSREVANRFNIDTTKFNIIHFGAMGVANGLEYVVRSAKVLMDRGVRDVSFLLLGDGAARPKLQQFVDEHRLDNVLFLGEHKMAVVSEVVNCCDLSVTSFLDLPILYTNSPNKLFDSLSAGIPIVVNSAGWTKDLVESCVCGFYVDPRDPEDFADKIMAVKADRELLRSWGESSRRLALSRFDREILSKKMVDVVEACFEKMER